MKKRQIPAKTILFIFNWNSILDENEKNGKMGKMGKWEKWENWENGKSRKMRNINDWSPSKNRLFFFARICCFFVFYFWKQTHGKHEKPQISAKEFICFIFFTVQRTLYVIRKWNIWATWRLKICKKTDFLFKIPINYFLGTMGCGGGGG